jgi:hypothetical protein
LRWVAESSVGRVLLDFYGDGVVGIALFDEAGRETKDGEWGDAEVAKGLFYVAGVPEDEARAIEARVVGEWEARGGRPTGKWDVDEERAALAVGAGVIVVLALLVIGIVTTVRQVVAWLS